MQSGNLIKTANKTPRKASEIMPVGKTTKSPPRASKELDNCNRIPEQGL